MELQPKPCCFEQHVRLPYAEAVDRAKAALKEEGFGVLFEIGRIWNCG